MRKLSLVMCSYNQLAQGIFLTVFFSKVCSCELLSRITEWLKLERTCEGHMVYSSSSLSLNMPGVPDWLGGFWSTWNLGRVSSHCPDRGRVIDTLP